MGGTLYAVAIIVLVSILTVFVFTGSLKLSLVICSSVLCILCTCLGYFYLAGWSLGILEARPFPFFVPGSPLLPLLESRLAP